MIMGTELSAVDIPQVCGLALTFGCAKKITLRLIVSANWLQGSYLCVCVCGVCSINDAN